MSVFTGGAYLLFFDDEDLSFFGDISISEPTIDYSYSPKLYINIMPPSLSNLIVNYGITSDLIARPFLSQPSPAISLPNILSAVIDDSHTPSISIESPIIDDLRTKTSINQNAVLSPTILNKDILQPTVTGSPRLKPVTQEDYSPKNKAVEDPPTLIPKIKVVI